MSEKKEGWWDSPGAKLIGGTLTLVATVGALSGIPGACRDAERQAEEHRKWIKTESERWDRVMKEADEKIRRERMEKEAEKERQQELEEVAGSRDD